MDAQKPSSKPAWPTNPATVIANLKGHTGRTTALAFSCDRCLLASSAQDGTGRIWDVASRKPGERGVIRKDGDSFASMAFSANNRQLAVGTGSLSGTAWVYDVTEKTPQEVATLRGGKGAITAITFSPDNKLVAGGGEDQTIRIWEPIAGGTGTPRTMLKGHTSTIKSLTFSPNSQELASACKDNTVRLWTLSRIRSTERAVLQHESEVYSVVYAPNAQTLITGGMDKVIRLWDLTAIKPKVKMELKGHTGAIRLVWLTADSKMLVSVCDGPRIMNWDFATGKPLGEWQVPQAETSVFAVTVDGRYLANGTSEGNVDVHRVAEKRA